MANEITTTESFQQRMFDKIREQMGDLLTDDDLKKIVAESVERAFFRPREERDRWGHVTAEASYFQQLMADALKDRAYRAFNEWMQANQERIDKAVNDAIAKGALRLVMLYLDEQFAQQFQSVAGQFVKREG